MDLVETTAQRILGACSCHEAYKSRGLTAPDCVWCDCSAELIEALRATRREALERAAEIARNCTVEQYCFPTPHKKK